MQIRVAVPPGRFHRDAMDADVLGLQDGGVIKILLDNERKMGDKECGEVTSGDSTGDQTSCRITNVSRSSSSDPSLPIRFCLAVLYLDTIIHTPLSIGSFLAWR